MENIRFKFPKGLNIKLGKLLNKTSFSKLYKTNEPKYLMYILRTSTEYEQWINRNNYKAF